MFPINHQSYPQCLKAEEIKTCLANIEKATGVITGSLKVISDNQARIYTLINQPVQRNFLSTQASPPSPSDSNEDDDASGTDLPCPDCGKGCKNEKARKRHYETHIFCTQISDEDTKCLCCKQPIQLASKFFKNHATCLTRVADQLSETTRHEASQQKRRIREAVDGRYKNAVEELSKKKTKRCRDDRENEPLPKRRITDADAVALQAARQSDSTNETYLSASWDSYSAVDMSFMPDLDTGSSQTASFLAQPEEFCSTDIHGATTDLQGTTTDLNDGHYRGLTMTLNPGDGVLCWDVSNA